MLGFAMTLSLLMNFVRFPFPLDLELLHSKDMLLVAGIMCVAVGLINILRIRRIRKRALEALANGKHWF